jgi:transcriptional regulator with XRE-family HTH domain
MELKILRKAAGLTQKQLGDQAGVDDSQISLVENRERNLGGMAYYTVVRIGRALVPGIPIEDVFPVPVLPTERPSQADAPPTTTAAGK